MKYRSSRVKLNRLLQFITATILIASVITGVIWERLTPLFAKDSDIQQQTITIRTQDGTVVPGEFIEIPVEVLLNETNASIGVITVNLIYDPTVLEAESCIITSGFTGACNIDIVGEVRFAAINPSGVALDFSPGTVTFKAIGTTGASTILQTTVDSKGTVDGNRVTNFVTEDGQINIGSSVMGDVNCNDLSDAVDALYILQYAVGMRVENDRCPLPATDSMINTTTGDTNGDDVVDAVDALMAMQCDVGIQNVLCPESLPAINLALEKETTQSSMGWGGLSSRAVDGVTNGNYPDGSVAHTQHDKDPWWQVDLGADKALGTTFDIERIILHNRTDCCEWRLSEAYVFVSNRNMTKESLDELKADESVWKFQIGQTTAENISIEVGQPGRFIKIQKEGEREFLSLAEVQVFGSQQVGDGNVLQIGRISEEPIAVESTGQAAQYLLQRSGDLAPTTYEFQIRDSSTYQMQARARAFLQETYGLAMHNITPATPNDYVIKTANGAVLTDRISFEEGQEQQTIMIEATQDDKAEVPEQLYLELLPVPDVIYQYVNPMIVTFVDNPPGINDDSTLLLGQFRAEGNALTIGSGYATVRLSGDNSHGLVNVSFRGLTSEQTAAHIHIGNPESGPVIESLPMGQVTDHQWDVRASQFIVTDQEMLETLLGGGLYVNVHSTNYPSGELRATLYQSQGSSGTDNESAFDYPTPDYEMLTGEKLTQDIYRFLSQATFGATPALVADLEARVAAKDGDRIAAYSEWIDEQMGVQSPSHQEYSMAWRRQYEDGVEHENHAIRMVSNQTAFHTGILTSMVHAKAQLRERAAFALSEIVVVGEINQRYNLLRKHAFGSMEELLYDVSRSSMMGHWLTYIYNQKTTYDDDGNILTSPDENYARELMQLFSIGLLELNPDGTFKLDKNGLPIETYTQQDITELARLFTGWSYALSCCEDEPEEPEPIIIEQPVTTDSADFLFRSTLTMDRSYSYISVPYQSTPMKNFDAYHDFGRKEILGYVFPAGRDGETELRQIVDILAAHANTGPFIAYRLIQRLTTSNPSPAYIYRVTQAYDNGNKNLGEMLRAILLDPEARNLAPNTALTAGRIHEPFVRIMAMCRLLECGNSQNDLYPLSNLVDYGFPQEELTLYEADAQIVPIHWRYFGLSESIQQYPYHAPTVFNWWEPGYAPPGAISEAGMVAPEMQHLNELHLKGYYNTVYKFLYEPEIQRGYQYKMHHQDTVWSYITRQVAPKIMVDAYMNIMDTNQDGAINPDDTPYNDPVKVREATAAIVDVADGYFCNGWLKAEATGNPDTDPREIILDAVFNAYRELDSAEDDQPTVAGQSRATEAILLTLVAPQCTVQR